MVFRDIILEDIKLWNAHPVIYKSEQYKCRPQFWLLTHANNLTTFL